MNPYIETLEIFIGTIVEENLTVCDSRKDIPCLNINLRCSMCLIDGFNNEEKKELLKVLQK